MSKFLLIFITCLMVLFTVELLNPVQAAVIQPFTAFLAWIAASVVLPFDDSVISSGRILRDSTSGFAVSIEAGCNGVEASIVLIAGVLAFPATWRQRIAAITLGFLAIQLLNVLRIVSLFYLGQWNFDIFEWTHLYLWPVLIMLDVLLVFALYLRWLSRSDPSPEHA
ncbi:exosortase H [Luminiphilus sp.]|nr:exosortase H [Luminiphilus sp.]